jgi:hypothetical protein
MSIKQYSGIIPSMEQELTSSKNPNRVLGGIRGSGTETLTVMTEDGIEQKLPSMSYIKGLEMKLTDLNEKVKILERLINQKT